MKTFNELAFNELQMIEGGDVRDVVTTVAGVCGGISGAIGGFALGYSAAGNVFTGPIAVGAGCVAGVTGAIGGYVGAKTGAEAAWDAIANSFN